MSSEQIWILVSAFLAKWPVDLADFKELHGLYGLLYGLLYILCLLNARKQSFRSTPNESRSTDSIRQVPPCRLGKFWVKWFNLVIYVQWPDKYTRPFWRRSVYFPAKTPVRSLVSIIPPSRTTLNTYDSPLPIFFKLSHSEKIRRTHM